MAWLLRVADELEVKNAVGPADGGAGGLGVLAELASRLEVLRSAARAATSAGLVQEANAVRCVRVSRRNGCGLVGGAHCHLPSYSFYSCVG